MKRLWKRWSERFRCRKREKRRREEATKRPRGRKARRHEGTRARSRNRAGNGYIDGMQQAGTNIAGTGSALPEKRLTNDDLSKLVDTNDEWIVQRTGIRERRVASEGETTASLGTLAARRALA